MAGISFGVITISDKASRGERQDRGGPEVGEVLVDLGWQEAVAVVVPDERDQVAAALHRLADELDLPLVVTTGGTGLSPRDVTPQATLEVVDYEVPGMAEAMRAASLAKTPAGMLSRAVVGVRGRTLIVNLPGSPKAVRECLEAILPALPHAIETLRAEIGDHTRPES